uniref:Uncharacterized protein LOC116946652 n=1 Tax=Petromyzon marinus TaxID=7757 RepID=A0AAJ7X160_PETMA|nr:uncharacterized protein LOC116946652 [Petromyzon marinus]
MSCVELQRMRLGPSLLENAFAGELLRPGHWARSCRERVPAACRLEASAGPSPAARPPLPAQHRMDLEGDENRLHTCSKGMKLDSMVQDVFSAYGCPLAKRRKGEETDEDEPPVKRLSSEGSPQGDTRPVSQQQHQEGNANEVGETTAQVKEGGRPHRVDSWARRDPAESGHAALLPERGCLRDDLRSSSSSSCCSASSSSSTAATAAVARDAPGTLCSRRTAPPWPAP